jgi:hypothetical protein
MRLLSALFATATSVSLLAQVPSYVPTTGLIGWWPFNGNANDESGGGNDGTLFGPVSTEDRNGIINAAYDFDGISSHIVIPNVAIQGAASRTYSFWMRTSNQIGGMMLATGSGANLDGGTFNVRHGQFTGFMGGNFNSGGYDYDPAGNVVVNDDQWHHVVVTYDGSVLTFYMDGSFEKSTTLAVFTDGQTNYVGKSNDQNVGNEAFFQGQVDDIGAWNRVLDSLEVEGLFNAEDGPCISTTPVSYSGLDAGYVTTDAPVVLVGVPVGGVFIGDGISGNTFSPPAAGEGTHGISYVYLDSNNCVNSFSSCTSVSIGMGLEDPAPSLNGVRVFPNPNHGQFAVQMELEGLVSLQVFDARGRQVHNEVFRANGGLTMRTLNLSALANGTYNLQVRLGKSSVNQRVVVE